MKSTPRRNRWMVGILLAIGLFGQPALCWPQETLAQLTKASGDPISAVAPAWVTLSAPNQPSIAKALEAYGKLPLSFEANQRRIGPPIKFLVSSGGYVPNGTHQMGFHAAASEASKALVMDQVATYSPYPGPRLGDEEGCKKVLAQVNLASHGPKPDSQPAPPPAEALEVSLSGWFTVIWNDTTRYFLTDDQGQWTELLLDEEMTKPFGGPLALNRKRVKILGVSIAAPPGAVRVLSIAFE